MASPGRPRPLGRRRRAHRGIVAGPLEPRLLSAERQRSGETVAVYQLSDGRLAQLLLVDSGGTPVDHALWASQLDADLPPPRGGSA